MNVQRGSQHSGHMMPAATDKNFRALRITALLTGVYFIIELGIGIYTGSIAVLSDSFHTFSAVGGVFTCLRGEPATVSDTISKQQSRKFLHHCFRKSPHCKGLECMVCLDTRLRRIITPFSNLYTRRDRSFCM